VSVLQTFTLFFVLTVAALGAAVFTGFKARRRWHIASVVGVVAMLGATIYFALEVGKIYDLESAGVITPIHLTLAKITTAAYLLPIIAGLRTIYRPASRALHRRLAYVALTMTVLSAITGAVMILMSAPREVL
jgi:hypothetical protein